MPAPMRSTAGLHRRTAHAVLVSVLALGVAAACDSDDDGLTDERGDLNEDFGSVPGATVESPAVSETAAPTGAAPPFGTVAVDGEVYPVDGMDDDGGDFTACAVEPPDRPGYIDVTAALDERTFNFNVVQDTAGATLGTASTVVDDYEIDGTSVRGTADFDDGTVVFDITC